MGFKYPRTDDTASVSLEHLRPRQHVGYLLRASYIGVHGEDEVDKLPFQTLIQPEIVQYLYSKRER